MIEELNWRIARVETVMKRYSHFGAEDTEPDALLQATMYQAVTTGMVVVPQTAGEWDLFTDSMDCTEAGAALTKATEDLCRFIATHRHHQPLVEHVKAYCWRIMLCTRRTAGE